MHLPVPDGEVSINAITFNCRCGLCFSFAMMASSRLSRHNLIDYSWYTQQRYHLSRSMHTKRTVITVISWFVNLQKSKASRDFQEPRSHHYLDRSTKCTTPHISPSSKIQNMKIDLHLALDFRDPRPSGKRQAISQPHLRHEVPD